MAVPTFTPPQNPNVGYGVKTKARVLKAQFGDGYAQRVGDGLNALARPLSLSWGPISPANADAIENFFRARGGFEPFFYTTPLDALRGLSARRYICSDWDRVTSEINQETVTATFEEDFGLST